MATDSKENVQEASPGGNSTSLFPDFVLIGDEFSSLRRMVVQYVCAKAMLERAIAKTPQGPEGRIADLSDKEFGQVYRQVECFGADFSEACVKLKEVQHAFKDTFQAASHCTGKGYKTDAGWVWQMNFDTEESIEVRKKKLSAAAAVRSTAIVRDLVLVRGFFQSIFWLFCSESNELYPNWMTEVINDQRLKATGMLQHRIPALVPWGFVPRLCGARLLSICLENWPRLRYHIWACPAFVRGLKTLIQQAEPCSLMMDCAALDSVLYLLTALSNGSHTDCNKPLLLYREAVEVLNSCEAGGRLDFSRYFRACYRFQEAGWKGSKEKQTMVEKLGASAFSIFKWGFYVRVLQHFGMTADIVRAERTAFASPDPDTSTSGDALCLFEHALKADASLDPEVNSGFQTAYRSIILPYRAKALEMVLQNPKVMKEAEKGKVRVLQALYKMDSQFEVLVRERQDREGEGEGDEQEEQHRFPSPLPAWLFTAALILRLESSLRPAERRSLNPPLDESNRSTAQCALLDWLRLDRKTDNPSSLLSKVPLCNVSSFLDKEVTKASCLIQQQKQTQGKTLIAESEESQESEKTAAACQLLALACRESPLEEHIEEEGQSPRKKAEREAQPTQGQSGTLSTQVSNERRPSLPNAIAVSVPDRNRTYVPLRSRSEVKAVYPFACDNCGKEKRKSQNCVGCKLAVYCSRE